MHDPSQVKPRFTMSMTPELVHSLDIFGANGTLDNLIKECLKQPDHIKISFEKGAKEITGHFVPDQA
jgi:hypothetical protein